MVALILFVLLTFTTGCVVVVAVVADARRRGLPVLPVEQGRLELSAHPAAAERTAQPRTTTPPGTTGAEPTSRRDHGHRPATV